MTRLAALLLLLLQLHPIFGAAACLRSQLTRRAADCTMPPPRGDGGAVASLATVPGTAACPFAQFCAPVAPAIVPGGDPVGPAALPAPVMNPVPLQSVSAPAAAPLAPPPRA